MKLKLRLTSTVLGVVLVFAGQYASAQSFESTQATKVMQLATLQYEAYIKNYPEADQYPRSINPDGSIKRVPSIDWTCGFWAGNLWYMYKLTGDKQWLSAAKKWTESLAKEQYNTTTHDLGFMLFDSYGAGYSVTHDTAYRKVLLNAARSLSSRFHAQVGAIKSWDDLFHYPVIVDNLMNLELLFWAAKASGDTTFRHIAIKHADTDLKYRYRPDNSSYHVLDFDPATGKLLGRHTHQGFADSSCWARGQTWSIYGNTVLYRYTHKQRYLERAIKSANYFLKQTDAIPDHIPYWDFQAAGIPNVPRDASAAAVAASALLELSKYAPVKYHYYNKALQLLNALCTPKYLAKAGTNNYFLLMHSTGHKPAGTEIDAPLVYADYYFLEALWRLKNYKNLAKAL